MKIVIRVNKPRNVNLLTTETWKPAAVGGTQSRFNKAISLWNQS